MRSVSSKSHRAFYGDATLVRAGVPRSRTNRVGPKETGTSVFVFCYTETKIYFSTEFRHAEIN